MTRGEFWLYALIFGGSLVACVTNHAALEKRPDSGSGGTGGTSAAAGSFPQLGGAAAGLSSGGGHSDDEPRGKSALTIVNGVVDAPRAVLCFAKVDTDRSVVPFGDPLSAAPLEYGQTLVLADVPGADLAADTLQLLVIAGDLELVAGLDCQAAVDRAQSEEASTAVLAPELAQGGAAGDSSALASAGAKPLPDGGASGETDNAGAGGAPPTAGRSRLRVRGLPAIAPGTLNMGRSLVLVANGCLAGRGFSGPHAEQYCGLGYSESEPTLSACLVNLSRKLSYDHVGMQVVNASLANAQVDLKSRPAFPSDATGVPIVSGLVEGQVAPRPALLTNTAFDYGSSRLHVIEVSAQGGTLFSQSWQDVLARGGIPALVDQTTYALVLSGPQGDLPAVPDLWNAPALTAIAADPAP
jgi:hypothetical protein